MDKQLIGLIALGAIITRKLEEEQQKIYLTVDSVCYHDEDEPVNSLDDNGWPTDLS